MTFASHILEAANGLPIIAIVIGDSRGYRYDGPDHVFGNIPVSWEEAFHVLNYEYDTGYGAQDCHDIWAWTEKAVLFVHEYDGSTSVQSVPRNPQDF